MLYRMDLWNSLQTQWQSWMDSADARISHWFLVENPWPVFAIVATYLLFVKYGTLAMKNREPFDLKYLMLVYNFALVVLSVYISSELYLSARSLNYNFMCDVISYTTDEPNMRLASALWWYYISKVIDLMDTVIFILRKRNRQVTFLHVYHHSSMVLIWWAMTKWFAGGSSFFPSMINSCVHTVMYTYYFLSGFGDLFKKYLWWKKYLTMLQLAQFMMLMIHIVRGLVYDCKYDKRPATFQLVYLCTLVILFLNFYRQTYSKPKRVNQVPLKSNLMNGDVTSQMNHSNGNAIGHKKLH